MNLPQKRSTKALIIFKSNDVKNREDCKNDFFLLTYVLTQWIDIMKILSPNWFRYLHLFVLCSIISLPFASKIAIVIRMGRIIVNNVLGCQQL